MNTIDRLIHEKTDFKDFARAYGAYLGRLLEALDVQALQSLCRELEQARQKGQTVFVAGNGGSAGTASHMANDLGFGVRRHVDPPLRVMSLTDNVPVIMALSNDVGYEEVFLRQLQLYSRPGDFLLVISASGNSSNLVKAARWMKKQGGRVLGLLGFDGGELKGLCDVSVVVTTPRGEYGPVEDVHMIIDHILYAWFWSRERGAA